MKKLTTLLITLILIFSATGCGHREILVGKWINVHDGDVYLFDDNQAGTHDEKEITYSVDNNILSVVEGTSSAEPRNLTIVKDNDITKLIADSTYYVKEENYTEYAEKIKQESIDVLLSKEAWSNVNATAYLMFSKGGSGWTLLPGNTLAISWEMIDSNSVKIDLLDENHSMTLTVEPNNGNPRLLDKEGNVSYIPK